MKLCPQTENLEGEDSAKTIQVHVPTQSQTAPGHYRHGSCGGASASAQPVQAVKVLTRGGGKTIIQGGTGHAGGFLPVVTTIAFHAERQGQAVSGGFECLALVPAVPTGNGSGQFTINAMYVTGRVTSVQIDGETATLKGTATITGLGARLQRAIHVRGPQRWSGIHLSADSLGTYVQ